MKPSSIILTSFLVAVTVGPAKAANAKLPVGSVMIAGSDAGLCEFLGLDLDCDANYDVTAYQYEDGTVDGLVVDTSPDNKDVKGIPNCINFLGEGKAIVSGTVTESTIPWIKPGDPFQLAAKQGELNMYSPLRTISKVSGCDDGAIKHYFSDQQLVKHAGKLVEVKEPAGLSKGAKGPDKGPAGGKGKKGKNLRRR